VFEKRGIYWSRGGLWRKGDSSGMHQQLLSIDLDCDSDALRFTVIQHSRSPEGPATPRSGGHRLPLLFLALGQL